MLNRPVIIILLAVSFAGAGLSPIANAQVTYGTVFGYVYGPGSNQLKLGNVKVSIKNLATINQEEHSTITNIKGKYIFRILDPGDYQITATLDGYFEETISFTVVLNKIREVEAPAITLKHRPRAAGTLDNDLMISNNVAGNQQSTDNPDSVIQQQINYSSLQTLSEASDSFDFFRFDVSGNISASITQSQNVTKDQNKAAGTQTGSGQTAESTAQAQLVNLRDTSRALNFSQREILSLPIGGSSYMRSFDELMLLVSGVSPPPYTPGVRGPGIGFGIGTAGEFSVNGMRARSNNFSIDGSDNNDPDVGVRRQGFVAIVPQSLESINDISISTLLWDAELGRNFGSQVNAVSKYGSDFFYGQAYGFFTDSRLNARNVFDLNSGPVSGGEDPFTRTQVGLIFGGPITAKKTQFFGSYEHQTISASTEQHFSVPTAAERRFRGLSQFLVSKIFVATSTSFGVLNGATPLGNNILSFYPLPNNGGGPYGANTYTEILPADGRGEVASFKITQRITRNNKLNARYNFTDDNRVLPSIDRAIRSTIESNSRSQNLSLVFDAELRSNLLTLARFSFGRTRLAFSEYQGSPFLFSAQSNESVETRSGPQRVFSSTGPIGQLIIEPYDPVGVNAFLFPQGRVNNTFQYADLIYWQSDKHAIKFGLDVRRVELNSRQDRLYRPLVVFGNGAVTESVLNNKGNPVPSGEAQFFPGIELATLGLPSYILQSLTIDTPNSSIGLRFTEYSLFVSDNYQVRENLTFNYGLRYEYNTVPGEVHNRIVDSLMLKNISTKELPTSSPAFKQLQNSLNAYSQIVDGRGSIYPSDRNNFGPHIGFAWDPLCNQKSPDSCGHTAVRAGYGIYYDTILGAVVSQSRNVFPREIPINSNFGSSNFLTLNNPPKDLIKAGTLNQLAGNPATLAGTIGQLLSDIGSVGGGLAFTLPDKNLRTPYAQQWHLTVERELFKGYFVSAAYIGTKGVKLTRLVTPNLGPQLTRNIPFIKEGRVPEVFDSFVTTRPLPRPDSALGSFQIIENSASSSYHGLQLEGRKRYSHGYMFSVAYTWSHALDDVSDLFPIAGAPILAQDQSNLRLERGDANFDMRQRLTASFIWDSPFFRDSKDRFVYFLKDWQIAGILQANTGQPFTLNLPLDANQDGNLSDRPITTQGLIFIEGHGSRRVAISSDHKIEDFFRFGENGFIGRNTVRGNGFLNLDVALTRSFTLSERRNLRFRAEFFNLLNRANFGLPIRVLDAPGFGSSVDTVYPARLIQFAVKFQF
jgi:hypothetical protein